ncbi:MAG: hypothetical protein HY874_06770 [Chloroflexi bacterium]|nr:hypothetical protein [Chloroflexota bacterium]
MTFAVKLVHDEPRLVYLALVYHLGRPGADLDIDTKAPGAHGLRDVKVALGSDLDSESAIIDLDGEQYRKLLSAIYGCVNELRVYHMRGGAGGTTARFNETARALFPAIAADAVAALAVAHARMMLRRRLERAVERAAAADAAGSESRRAGRRSWPFGR